MSFSMTTEAVRNRTKTVTRRVGWSFLKPGDVLCAVEKGMGLKKGEKVVRLGLIRVVSVTHEDILAVKHYSQYEMIREGFPEMSPSDFYLMFLKANGWWRSHLLTHPVNRIEFEYIDDPA
jgi:hypothetical protein